MSAYAAFSQYYDALTQNVEYQARADLLCRLLEKWHHPAGITLDLACGTGSLTCELKKRGLDVYGIDASPDMLAKAQEKAAEEGLSILFLCQKMQQIDLYGTINTCFCTLDSLNHLPGKKALQKALHRLQFFVEPGGLFLFDVNTPYKHREVLGNNCFVRESEALFCVWQNEYTPEEHKVEIQMDFFRRGKGEQYTRDGEQFCEWAWEDEELTAMLEAEHFEVLERWGGYDRVPVMPTTQRMVYVARRR